MQISPAFQAKNARELHSNRKLPNGKQKCKMCENKRAPVQFSHGNPKIIFFLSAADSVTQRKQRIFLDVAESIDAFKAKIKFWMHPMETGKLAAFSGLNLCV